MQSITVTLPVRNLRISLAFFAELGFTAQPELSGPDSACLVIGENVRILLLAEEIFQDRVNGDLSHAGCTGKVMISVPADSDRQVDEIVTRAIVAGGRPWPVADDRHDYSGSFQDPDGNIWQLASARQPARIRIPAQREPFAA